MKVSRDQQRAFLQRVARQAMIDRNLEPEFSREAIAEVERLDGPAAPDGQRVEDLRAMPWSSIDNDDSRDLDQLTVAEALDGGQTRILIAVADVGTVVEPGSAIDDHAHANTTSVYTPARIFSMLPERLSTDLTSLNEGEDRLAWVAEVTVAADGRILESRVRRGLVHNHAKLAYPSMEAWLEGTGDRPAKIAGVPRLEENLRLQDGVAQKLRARRHEQGALTLQTLEPRAHLEGDAVARLEIEERNRAKELIEDFMIAANGAIARFLGERGFPVLRRVLRSPERWQRIVDLADELGEDLPDEPDARALNEFLLRRREADPLRFPDLSLSVVKMLGRGEYAATFPGGEGQGHFALAVTDYTHSTAPNRRYPDLITQRLVAAASSGARSPYSPDQLVALAAHCTAKEDDATKVERLVRKAAAACLMSDRVGDEFDGIVTGSSDKGTYVRVLDPPVEGRVTEGDHGLDVGDRVRVKLVHTNAERGYIDFARVGARPIRRRERAERRSR